MWVSRVHLEDGTLKVVAENQKSRKDAIEATRKWFKTNKMKPEPFEVYERETLIYAGRF